MIFIFVKLNFFFQFPLDGFHFPLRIFQFSIEDFSTPLSPSYEEGVLTPVPKPYAPTIGARDVTAPTRRSEPLRSKVGGASEPSPLFFTQQSCDFLCGVNRLDESLLQSASPIGRRCNTAQKSPIRRKTIATLLRKKSSPAP